MNPREIQAKAVKDGFESEACRTCDNWNWENHCCDFDGVCEEPVDPRIIQKESELLER